MKQSFIATAVHHSSKQYSGANLPILVIKQHSNMVCTFRLFTTETFKQLQFQF